jgi:DedD protein
MDTPHLKKRLTGAVITVLALAIIMPVVLDGSRERRLVQDADLPPRPVLSEDYQAPAVENLVRIELQELASGQAAKDIEMPDTEVVEKDAAVAPGVRSDRVSVDANQLPYAWTLQLGAFSQRDNAHSLRDQLRADGYKAYVQEFPQDRLTRVYVGPEIQRSRIEALQSELKKKLKQDDIHIKRYRTES